MIGKTFFNLLNAFLITIGLIIAFLGFFMNLQDEVPLAGVATSRLHITSFTIGIFGVVVIGTGIVGFCGVNRRIKFFTGIYSLLLGFAVVAFAALGVYVIMNHVEMADTIDENIKSKMKEYYSPNHTSVREELDNIQTKYECCGLRSAGSLIDVFGKNPIPKTCCDEYIEEECTLKDIFQVGCDEQLQKQLQLFALPLVGVSFACAVYCTVLIVLAICVKKKDDYEE